MLWLVALATTDGICRSRPAQGSILRGAPFRKAALDIIGHAKARPRFASCWFPPSPPATLTWVHCVPRATATTRNAQRTANAHNAQPTSPQVPQATSHKPQGNAQPTIHNPQPTEHPQQPSTHNAQRTNLRGSPGCVGPAIYHGMPYAMAYISYISNMIYGIWRMT
jgi:hypothetical protein